VVDADSDTDTDADTDVPAESDCSDDVDNDADGKVDCEAADCSELCAEGDCDDGLDGDADGHVDCDDDECWGLSRCAVGFELHFDPLAVTRGVAWGDSTTVVDVGLGHASGEAVWSWPGGTTAACGWTTPGAQSRVRQSVGMTFVSWTGWPPSLASSCAHTPLWSTSTFSFNDYGVLSAGRSTLGMSTWMWLHPRWSQTSWSFNVPIHWSVSGRGPSSRFYAGTASGTWAFRER
jgi:hypothetical protein